MTFSIYANQKIELQRCKYAVGTFNNYLCCLSGVGTGSGTPGASGCQDLLPHLTEFDET